MGAEITSWLAFPKLLLQIPGMPTRDRQFWDRHPGVVWSNPDAPDSAMISNALLQGKKAVLKDAAEHFGMGILRREWRKILRAAPEFPEIDRIVRISGKKTEAFLRTLSAHAHA